MICSDLNGKEVQKMGDILIHKADSSTLAWKIPWMENPGGLQSMGSKESDTTERPSTAQHRLSKAQREHPTGTQDLRNR